MGLIDNLKSGNMNTILLIVVLIFIFHLYWTREIKEPMADVQDSAIEASIKKIYKADVKAIRNLSNISKKLMEGGLTVPGNLILKNNLNINDFIIGANKDGGIGFSRKDGRTTHFDYTDNRNYIRGDTNMDGNTAVNGNLVVKNNLTINDYVISANKQYGLGFPRKDGRTTHFDYTDNKNYIRGSTIIDGEFTVNNGGSSLILQNDGNLVLYRNGKAVWASGTG